MAGLTLASPSAERRPAWSPWRETWRRYRRHKLAVVSAVLLIILIVAVVFVFGGVVKDTFNKTCGKINSGVSNANGSVSDSTCS